MDELDPDAVSELAAELVDLGVIDEAASLLMADDEIVEAAREAGL